MTTGAPNTAVTVLIESSVGEKIVLARRSENRQKTPPPRKHAGIITTGLEVPKSRAATWGTAMPTKDTGPAKAVTQAASRLYKTTSAIRNRPTFTPTLFAWVSPSW